MEALVCGLPKMFPHTTPEDEHLLKSQKREASRNNKANLFFGYTSPYFVFCDIPTSGRLFQSKCFEVLGVISSFL